MEQNLTVGDVYDAQSTFIDRININDTISKDHLDKSQYSLVVLFFFEFIFSVYINFRMVVIIFLTFKEEIKKSYYPILLIMLLLTFINTIVLAVFLVMVIYSTQVEYLFDITVIVLPAIIVVLLTPTLVSVLDFILCVHRLLIFFGSFKNNTSGFRWFGPICFLLISPFVVILGFISQVHSIAYVEGDNSLNYTFFIMFIIDNVLKVLFALFSFIGYLSILLAIQKSVFRLRDQTEDSYILRQALPIASFQLMSAIIQVFVEVTNQNKVAGEERSIPFFCFAYACNIVVPLSIILASSKKREIFANGCCYRPPEKRARVDPGVRNQA